MPESAISDPRRLLMLASDIAASYVARNHLPAREVPVLVTTVHGALAAIATGAKASPTEVGNAQATPSQIRKSITSDGLISFVDGKSYKTLKRHLTKHGFDADSYRARFGLPSDYPMTSPSYSERRSVLAKGMRFGKRQEAAQEPEPAAKTGRRGARKAATESRDG